MQLFLLPLKRRLHTFTLEILLAVTLQKIKRATDQPRLSSRCRPPTASQLRYVVPSKTSTASFNPFFFLFFFNFFLLDWFCLLFVPCYLHYANLYLHFDWVVFYRIKYIFLKLIIKSIVLFDLCLIIRLLYVIFWSAYF